MMRAFISSFDKKFDEYREQAEQAITEFAADTGIRVVILGSGTNSLHAPSSVDIRERLVASSSFVIGIYGSTYGTREKQTGLSMAHIELRWATQKYHKPIFAFVVESDQAEDSQKQLLHEVMSYRLGVFRETIKYPYQLKYELQRILHVDRQRLLFETSILNRYANIRKSDLYHYVVPLRATSSFEAMYEPTISTDPLLKDAVIDRLRLANTDITFILGEVGSGKTWFMKGLFCDLIEQYLREETVSLPIYVDLSQINFDEKLLESNLEALLLYKQYGVDETPSLGISLLDQMNVPVILLLDGYDEAVANSKPGAKLRILETLLLPLNDKTKIIITSRSQLFETEERLLRLLQGASYRGRRNLKDSPHLPSLIFIKQLHEEAVREFLRAEYDDIEGKLWSRIMKVIDLSDLVKRPMLLPMVCETLDELERNQTLELTTAGHLYRIYTSRWFSRDSWRLTFGESTARQFFEELALLFHNSGSDHIHFTTIPKKFPKFFPTEILSSEREQIEEGLRTATFFVSDPGGEYHFIHRSFLEYFLAERIVSAITASENNIHLVRFPSKVTDRFIQDLLTRESGWERKLLEMIRDADEPIMRYLAVYLANRLASPTISALDENTLSNELVSLLNTERDPVVVREMLVTLATHNIALDSDVLMAHLSSPIPQETIVRELKEYYGSLEEARDYVRERVGSGASDNLRLFYLISLASMANMEDKATFLHYADHGTEFERAVARQTLEELTRRESC